MPCCYGTIFTEGRTHEGWLYSDELANMPWHGRTAWGCGRSPIAAPVANVRRLPLYVPPTPDAARAGLSGAGMSIPVPASTALSGSLALMRALRPLRLRAPSPRRHTLDELVMDTGPAMAVRAKLEAELAVALQRLATRTSSRGARHPDTLSARLIMARAYAAEGRDDEARAILAEVLSELGPEHQDYWKARELEEALRR
jgi:hypothetical protein